MDRSRQHKGPVPGLAGLVAGIGVLAAAVAVGATLLLIRGPSLHAALQEGRQLDLMLLAAFVAGLAVFVGLRVAAAVRAATGASQDRQLVQRALEIDYADPDALAEFDTAPPLRELVAMLMTEKAQVRELGDRLETVHGEIVSLADGMERTGRDLGRMREENLSAASLRVVAAWNGLLGRVKETGAGLSGAAAPPAEIGALVARLDELEAELVRLQHAVDTSPVPGEALELLPVGEVEPADTAAPLAAPAQLQPAAASWGAAAGPANQPPGFAPNWGAPQDFVPQRRVVTWNSTGDIVEPMGPQPDDPDAAEVDAAFASLTGEAVAPGSSPAGAWPGASELFLPEAEAGSMGRPPAHTTPASTHTPSLEDTAFPHFVGRPVGATPGRLEVTYEANPGEEVVDLPASALLFEPEAGADPGTPAGVIDLRSLGATELES